MNDIVGSIWEDDSRDAGSGRFFLIVTAKRHPIEPSYLVVTTRDLDRLTEETSELDYDVRWDAFPFLDELRRIA